MIIVSLGFDVTEFHSAGALVGALQNAQDAADAAEPATMSHDLHAAQRCGSV